MFFKASARCGVHLITGIFALGVCSASMSALAQSTKPECLAHYEVIVPLREPDYRVSSEWRIVKEQNDYDALPYIVRDDKSQDVIAAGSASVLPKGEGLPNTDIQIMRVNRDGKEIWHQVHHRKGDQDVAGLVKLDNGGVAVVSTDYYAKGKGRILLSFFDKDGKKSFERIFSEDGVMLSATDMISVGSAGDLLVSANVRPEEGVRHTQIYRLSQKGKLIWKRAYDPSAENIVVGLGYDAGHDLIFGLGSIRLDDGRQAGLLMSLDDRGAVRWQEVYPRGKALILRDIAGDLDGGYVVSGDSRPYAKKDRHAGFVMKIDGAGEVMWQRYLAGRYYFYGQQIELLEDGRAVVLMDGQPVTPFDSGHSRFVLLNENGYLVGDEAFIENSDLSLRSFVVDRDGRRYVSGSTRNLYTEFDEADGVKSDDYRNFFVFALPPVPEYKSPCGRDNAFDEFLP